MNEPLKAAGYALDSATEKLDNLLRQQARQQAETHCDDTFTVKTIEILSLLIESIALLGEQVSLLTGTITSAGAVLAGQTASIHQCPECGLPIGTNASSDDPNNPCGCQTCTIVTQQHHNAVGNKCPDCGCLIGTNEENCRRCREEAYFQRADIYQASRGPTKHA